MTAIYDDDGFFSSYSDMTRSKEGLRGAGEWECVKTLLPDIKGFKILDLGCGFGWHAKYFISHGAERVEAIDVSRKMLQKAKEINDDKNISYSLCDIESFEADADSYDMVFSSLAIHYVSDYKNLIGKIHGWLKKGGTLLFSLEHPSFTAEGSEDWCYDEKGRIRHFPLDNYFVEGKRETTFLGCKVGKYHRTLTSYVEPLLEGGFSLTGLKELEVPSHLKDLEEMRNEWRRPMMLILKAEKK